MTARRRTTRRRPTRRTIPPPPPAPPSTGERIRDAEISIRDRVSDAKLQPRLMKDAGIWNQITSSLDAIGDTEQALAAYVSRYPPDPDFGSRYLFAYGVLQALFIQQDAVVHLSEALGGSNAKAILGDQRIKAAREIRNRAVGHPTKKDKPRSEPVTTHQISRVTLGQAGFDMLTADAQGQAHFESVNVLALIHGQQEAVAEILEALDERLDREDKETRRAFKHESLVALFPNWLGYSFEKLSEATTGDPYGILGSPNLEAVKKVMREFAQALERRGLGIEAYPGIKIWYAEIEHPIQELERFFDSAAADRLHPKTAAIVVGHLRQKLEELKHMAGEIDEDWRVDEP